ncbi:MAG: dehydrogenase E1 component subunit alpha/beta [Ignavibacteriaceae bacterium]|nr:dehydrogenase E1 component subunit alpha/beta [Ignavibacteriaceae bacterium]
MAKTGNKTATPFTGYEKKASQSNGKNNGKLDLTREDLLKNYKIMYTARHIDVKAMNYLKQGKTFFHIAGSGHEAVQVAFGQKLNPKVDWAFPYYRDLALILAMGYKPIDFFMQSFAKRGDLSSGGRQLPCHWGYTRELNLPTQSSPTGTQFLQAVGTALAAVKKGIKSVSYVSSGEGTTSQGEFHEAINWASREKLPVVFVIQNNKYAISVHVSQQSGGKGHSISEMMAGYDNLLRMKIDGTSFIDSMKAAEAAYEYARSGKGPVLVEAECVRLLSHSSSDDQKKYRDIQDLEEDLRNDPIEKFSNYVLSNNLLSQKELDDIQVQVREEVERASAEALNSEDARADEAAKYVYDESGYKESFPYEKEKPSGAPIVMVDAINHALHEEMEKNSDIYVFGEDIADGKGGVFTATKGLTTKFGLDRVFNSPLAEASIMGVATGMAFAGLRPVVEIQFGDYIWPAFMQMKDELATIRYRSFNYWSAPVVTRVAVGGYIHGGLYHSQNIEAIFAHVPGIYIAYPSNSADAKGLLKTAMRINDPVLFCEHKGLYRQSFAIAPEPNAEYLLPFGKGKIVMEGSDVTVVTYGASVWDSVFAAKKLIEDGYSVEIIDLRTIVPLDEELIYNSVKKTGKIIVIHEDTLTAGFGAEIAARVTENCFQYLDGPVRRVAAKDAHIPYSPILENAILPSREGIYKSIKELILY